MWAQDYPDEVEAIVGLDMATPEAYDMISGDTFTMKLSYAINITARECGIFRLLSDDALLNGGELTDEEKNIYRKIFIHQSTQQECHQRGRIYR